jgi:hypothetical protein
MNGVAKLRRAKTSALRQKSWKGDLGTFRNTHILFIGIILPLFCLLDLTIEISRDVQTRQILQSISDIAVVESAQKLAQGGSRLDIEASTLSIFQAKTDRGHAKCAIRSVRLSKLERYATLESICQLRPRLGALLLGGAKGPILVSSKAVFDEVKTETDSVETFTQIRLVE